MERVPDPQQLTRPEAERLLKLYGGQQGRERMVLAAHRLGISAAQIQKLGGIARDTVARILSRNAPPRATITWRPNSEPATVGEHTALWRNLEHRARDLVLGLAWTEHQVVLRPDEAVITLWPERHAPDGAWDRAMEAVHAWVASEAAGETAAVTLSAHP